MSLDKGITHLFFDLTHTLIDPQKLTACFTLQLEIVMSKRYGPAPWRSAYQHILADWDSYHADLNFSGQDGIADIYEAHYRITRALFRLAGQPEPPHDELTSLSRELPTQVSRYCEAARPGVPALMKVLYQAGYQIGALSYFLKPQVEAILEGAKLRPYFNGPLLCPDVTQHYEKDAHFFRYAGPHPEKYLFVDCDEQLIAAASAAGLQTLSIARGDTEGLYKLLGL